jgi:hypothetical protein
MQNEFTHMSIILQAQFVGKPVELLAKFMEILGKSAAIYLSHYPASPRRHRFGSSCPSRLHSARNFPLQLRQEKSSKFLTRNEIRIGSNTAVTNQAMSYLAILQRDVSSVGMELRRAVAAERRAGRAVNTLARQYLAILRRYREALEQAVRVERCRQLRQRRLSRRRTWPPVISRVV